MWLDKNKPGYYLGGINKVKFKKTSTWLFYTKNMANYEAFLH